MTRQTIYTICAFLLLGIATVGTTYAFYSATASSNSNSVATVAQKYEVIFTGDMEINGIIPITTSKEKGFKRTVNIKISQDSVATKADIFLNINQMTQNFSVEGFIWEVYGYKNNQLVYSNIGNFKGYNSTNNNDLILVKNYLLTKDNTAFDIYLWIDGEQIDNNILNGSLSGYIGASTEQFTGQLG